MFKKTKLAAAMLAVVASSAQAVHVNPAGTGQVLIYPYYNTNNGFQTQLSIINTTGDAKAVKFRVRESDVSNDVLDFNIYMSPYDVWTATISKSGNNTKLLTADNTCTLPAIPANGVNFITAYDATDEADASEGYIEVIEMGVIEDNRVVDPSKAHEPDTTDEDYNPYIADAIDHGTDGVPEDCTQVAKAWDKGGFTEGGAVVEFEAVNQGSIAFPTQTAGTRNWTSAPAGLDTPAGGLAGNTILLNVETGSAYVIDPVAVDNYAADDEAAGEDYIMDSNGAQHYLSDDRTDYLLPSFASGNVLYSDKGTMSGRGVTEVEWNLTRHDYGKLDANLAPNESVPSGLNPFPMAAALLIKSFAGEYFIEEAFNGATDWIVTMPMKKHGIFSNNYVHDEAAAAVLPEGNTNDVCGDNADATEVCLAPLTSNMSGGAVDVEVVRSHWDREEQIPAEEETPPGFSPPLQVPGVTFSLPREVNILAVSPTDGICSDCVLGSTNAIALPVDFEKGWIRLEFEDRYDLVDLEAIPNLERFRYFHGSDVGGTATYPQTPTDPPLPVSWVTLSHDADENGGGVLLNLKGVPAIGAAATRGRISENAGDPVVGETFPLKGLEWDQPIPTP